jgi:hypothetical protein
VDIGILREWLRKVKEAGEFDGRSIVASLFGSSSVRRECVVEEGSWGS